MDTNVCETNYKWVCRRSRHLSNKSPVNILICKAKLNEWKFVWKTLKIIQKLTLDNVSSTLLKFALGYRLMNMSTTQWIKNFIFYSNSFRDNTQNKTHSRIRNTCYNYPTGIARVYFIKKSQNKTNLLNLSSLSIWFSCISGVTFETYLSWLSSSRLKSRI